MKRIVRQIFKLSLFSIILLLKVYTAQAQLQVSVKGVNGTCVSDCQIIATATDYINACTYQLYDSQGNAIGVVQSENTFKGLAPGTYRVGVYDGSTGSTPKLSDPITVTTSYVPMVVTSTTSSVNTALLCESNGTFSITFTGGVAPFRVQITNSSLPDSDPDKVKELTITSNSTSKTANFTKLKAGQYTYLINDKCEAGKQNIPGSSITVTNSVNFSDIKFTGLTVTTTSRYVSAINAGTCNNRISIRHSSSYIRVNTDGDPATFTASSYTSGDIKYKVEYPAYSGQYWGASNTSFTNGDWVNASSSYVYSYIYNYDRTQVNGDKYRVMVQHPCTKEVTFSDVITLPEEPKSFSVTSYNSYTQTGYCTTTQNPYISVSLIYTSAGYVNYYLCGHPYTISVTEKGSSTVLGTYTLNSGSYSYTFYNASISGGLIGGTTYTVTISNSSGFSQTNDVTIPANPSTSTFTPNYYYNNNNSYVYGYNYNRSCDFETSAIYAYPNIRSLGSITYSIIAPSEYASTRSPITLSSGYGMLWTDLPYGVTYTIKAEVPGCGDYQTNIPLAKTVQGFRANPELIQSPTNCERFRLNFNGFFYNMSGVNYNSTINAYSYNVLIIDGPANKGSSYSGYSSTSSSYSFLDNLPGGKYTLVYYGYNTTRTSQIINGVTMSYPVCILDSVTVEVPEYVHPTINVPLSGGIACDDGNARMTITVDLGDSPPFYFRYKTSSEDEQIGDDDDLGVGYPATWTGPHTDINFFENLPPGWYKVQILDNCGSITTQKIKVYDGTEQFLTIVGEAVSGSGIVCEGSPVTFTVLSIGPVEWYKWYYRAKEHEGDDTKWELIPGAGNNPTYNIPSAQLSDIGGYKIKISNGSCELESEVKIVDVILPAPTPSITGDNTVCPGNTTPLTAVLANGTETPVSYQWYKDGVAIANANYDTYSAGETGTYTVVITPFQKCSSAPSAGHYVEVKSPDAPAITGGSNVCTGGTVTLSANPHITGATYTWYKNGTVVFTSGTTNTYDATSGGSYTVTVNTGVNCTSGHSYAHNVVEFEALIAGTITGPQTLCYGSDAATLVQSTLPTGGLGSGYTYQWQSSIDDATWNPISGQTTTSYTPTGLIQTTYFRLEVSSICGASYTPSVKITVYDQLVAGVIGNDQAICYNTIPNQLTGTLATGGTGSYTYQWQQSANGTSGWVNVSGGTGATTANYTPPALTVTTYYRRVVTSGTCGTGNSNVVKIEVYNDLVAGLIGNDQSICYNTTPGQLTGSLPTGGTGSYTYQWQQSANGTSGWVNVSGGTGATTANYTPPALTVTTYYRRVETSGACGPVNSNVIKITVYNDLVAGTISAAQTICYNTIPNQLTGTLPTGGTGSYTYQWQQSTNGSSGWVNVTGGTGATSPSYTPAALTATTFYRRAETSGTCGPVYSNVIKITVYDELKAGVISASQTVCEGGIPSVLTGSTPTGGEGSYTYQWQQSANGTSGWVNVSGGTGSTSINYSPPALTATTYYRRVESSGSCGTVYSNVVEITVDKPVTPNATGTTICDTETIGAFITVHSPVAGYTYKVYNAATGGAVVGTATAINNNDIQINCGIPVSDITYYVEAESGFGCTSSRTSVDIKVITIPVSSLSAATICDGDNLIIKVNPSIVGVNYEVFSIASGGTALNTTVLGTGGEISIDCGPVSVTGGHVQTFYVEANTSGIGGCFSLRQQVNVTVNYNGGGNGYGIISVQDKYLCYNTSARVEILGTTNPVPTGTVIYKWYTSQTAPTVFHEGNFYDTPNLTATTKYYISVTADNYCENKPGNRKEVTVYVYDDFNPGSIMDNQTICYNQLPAMFTSVSAPTGGDGNYTYEWQMSTDNGTWTAIPATNSATYTHATGLRETTYFRRKVSSGKAECGTLYSNSVKVTVREQIAYPDIRVKACPENPINLTKYLNNTYYKSVNWTPSGYFQNGGNDNGILVDATLLKPYSTYKFEYEITNFCVTKPGVLYMTMLANDKLVLDVSQVRICYEQADLINLNAIFGVEAGGTWRVEPVSALPYLEIVTTGEFEGAAYFKGTEAWYDPTIPKVNDEKKIDIIYESSLSGCLNGKEFRVTLILTEDLTN